jgi:hypothetical protein
VLIIEHRGLQIRQLGLARTDGGEQPLPSGQSGAQLFASDDRHGGRVKTEERFVEEVCTAGHLAGRHRFEELANTLRVC